MNSVCVKRKIPYRTAKSVRYAKKENQHRKKKLTSIIYDKGVDVKMLENGMLLNQGKYDIQMQEPQKIQCFLCGNWVPEYDIDESIDDFRGKVCVNCQDAYCKEQAADQDVQAVFIQRHEPEFYLDYWLLGLEESELVHIAKQIFQRYLTKDIRLRKLKQDFCANHEDFYQFLVRDVE